jgi:UDP-N-acetyl-D-glucosamine dehydrogenase
VVRPILESSGLRAGTDFALAYSSERIDPGRAWRLRDTPRIVAGLGPADGVLARSFYEEVGFPVVEVASLRVAEMAKLIENTFRQVNIALVNELATVGRELDVDIWAAIEAAATKPYGFMPFWPGPGVGGHCIAIDPTYLSWRVGQRLGFGIGFVEHANQVNKRMPAYVASRIGEALNEVGKPLKGSRILVLGLAYKADVDDVRESPAVAVVEKLARSGATCSYHDPFVPRVDLLGEVLRSVPLEREVLAAQDCVAILTAHSEIDYGAVVRAASLVFDARGVTRQIPASKAVLL